MRSTYIYIQTYTIPRRCTHRTIGTQGHPRAPRASNPFCRRQEDIFVFFFGYRARRLRPPHRGRACPVACSKARAASTSLQACQIHKRFALASQHIYVHARSLLPFQMAVFSSRRVSERAPLPSLLLRTQREGSSESPRGRADSPRSGLISPGDRGKAFCARENNEETPEGAKGAPHSGLTLFMKAFMKLFLYCSIPCIPVSATIK